MRYPAGPTDADPAPATHGNSKRPALLGRLAVALTAILAVVSIYAGSTPVWEATDLTLSMAWAFASIAWSWALFARATDRVARLAAGLLVLGFVLSIAIFGPLGLTFIFGPLVVLLFGLTALPLLALVMVRERPRPWTALLAPAIVIATLAIVLSGIPRNIRFALAEPALTEYAERVQHGDQVPRPSDDGPISVGGISIREVRQEGAELFFVTAYVGILGDIPAGLAYAPSGQPIGPARYEHLSGPWYRWLPDFSRGVRGEAE